MQVGQAAVALPEIVDVHEVAALGQALDRPVHPEQAALGDLEHDLARLDADRQQAVLQRRLQRLALQVLRRYVDGNAQVASCRQPAAEVGSDVLDHRAGQSAGLSAGLGRGDEVIRRAQARGRRGPSSQRLDADQAAASGIEQRLVASLDGAAGDRAPDAHRRRAVLQADELDEQVGRKAGDRAEHGETDPRDGRRRRGARAAQHAAQTEAVLLAAGLGNQRSRQDRLDRLRAGFAVQRVPVGTGPIGHLEAVQPRRCAQAFDHDRIDQRIHVPHLQHHGGAAQRQAHAAVGIECDPAVVDDQVGKAAAHGVGNLAQGGRAMQRAVANDADIAQVIQAEQFPAQPFQRLGRAIGCAGGRNPGGQRSKLAERTGQAFDRRVGRAAQVGLEFEMALAVRPESGGQCTGGHQQDQQKHRGRAAQSSGLVDIDQAHASRAGPGSPAGSGRPGCGRTWSDGLLPKAPPPGGSPVRVNGPPWFFTRRREYPSSTDGRSPARPAAPHRSRATRKPTRASVLSSRLESRNAERLIAGVEDHEAPRIIRRSQPGLTQAVPSSGART